ncbi:hypothetical protein DQ04_07581010 [Trypanosoma grayi]|uniref:hypothetical protein n=1 Tax=Trypanosoma grayi TaxID=71804 RepID=UPI0004F44AE1|nr:hypothetical protein DQ04_07581010 [Trypanosoma grayi]KEG08267.1 hypothetical protein DQ04_07581010 [Trypanosoma grayi]
MDQCGSTLGKQQFGACTYECIRMLIDHEKKITTSRPKRYDPYGGRRRLFGRVKPFVLPFSLGIHQRRLFPRTTCWQHFPRALEQQRALSIHGGTRHQCRES